MVDESKSQSHLWAWVILITLVAIGTVMIIWKRCYLKDNLLMESKLLLCKKLTSSISKKTDILPFLLQISIRMKEERP